MSIDLSFNLNIFSNHCKTTDRPRVKPGDYLFLNGIMVFDGIFDLKNHEISINHCKAG